MKHLPLALLTISLFASLSSAQAPNPSAAGQVGAAKNSADAGKQQPAPSSTQGQGLDAETNPGDPLLDVPPLPKGNATLVGGIVAKMDSIRSRLTLEPYGKGEQVKVFFDERTHIYRDGTETTQANIHKGDRVYIDTMLDGPHVFARNIRVVTQQNPADASGQVIAYNSQSGVMTLQDQLSTQPVTFSVNPQTVVKKTEGGAGSAADLKPGSLVSVRFAPSGRRGVAQEIGIIAVPGTAFTFAGKVTHLNLRTGVIAVENQSDNKTYDIDFDSARTPLKDELTVGSQVVVEATFTGKGYRAEKISMNQ